MNNSLLKVLASVVLVSVAWAQDRGVITGTVLDEHGAPVVGAKVLITEKGVFVQIRAWGFIATTVPPGYQLTSVSA